MEDKKILCCIFNYKHSENAIKWAESLKDDFAVSILDTYVLDNSETDDPLTAYNGNVLLYHNIFLGGLTIEAFKLCVGGCFDFLLIINSDVEIDEENLQHLKWRLHNLPDNVGIYEVSATKNSCVMGVVGEIPYTRKYFQHDEDEFKKDGLAEGWLYGLHNKCIKQILPYLSVEKNKYGWGIGSALLSISKNNGFQNVIDSNVFVFHPKGTAYNVTKAKYEWYAFDQMSEKMGFPESFITIVYCAKKHNEKYQKYLISYFSDATIIVEKICNTDNIKEVLNAYNEAITSSLTHGILLLGENTFFDLEDNPDKFYNNVFQEIFFNNKEYGIIGCAAKYISNNNIIERKEPPVFAFGERDGNTSACYESFRGELHSYKVFEDAIVDGRFLAVRKDRIKHLFNTEEDIPYDDEFCISNYLDGVKVGVTKAILFSYSTKNEINKVKTDNLLKKYEGKLPIKI